MRGLARRPPPRSRRGVTLAESLVGLVVAALLGVSLIALSVRQGAAGTEALVRSAARAQWAEARATLDADLAAIGQGASRLITVQDTAIELDAHVGVAVACRVARAGSHAIVVAAGANAAGVAADGWSRAVAAGDSVIGFDPLGGSWTGALVVSASASSCPSGPLAGSARSLTLAGALAADIPIGAPVAVRRRVRWNAYRASDGRWYLGVRERTSGAWAVVQPAAGPLDASAGRPRPFALLDAVGAPLSASAPLASAALLQVQLAMLGDDAADRTPIVAAIRRRP